MRPSPTIQQLPPEVLARVLAGLTTPDVISAERVCRQWRATIREQDLWLATTEVAQHSQLAAAAASVRMDRLEEVLSPLERCSNIRGLSHYRLPGSSSEEGEVDAADASPVVPRSEARLCLHKRLAWLLSRPRDDQAPSLLRNVLSASSTDHVEESVINLLVPEERLTLGLGPSYWSSKGSTDPESSEWLLARLAHPLCVVHEISLRPFRAWFQVGQPLYAPRAVRFLIGGALLFDSGSWELASPPGVAEGLSPDAVRGRSPKTMSVHAAWVSPVYEVDPNNSGLQRFELPHPVLCAGGSIVVELLGKRTRQADDDLYYVCLSHLRVSGSPLYHFAMDPGAVKMTLEALPRDALLDQGGPELLQQRLHAAVELWHARLGGHGLLVPAEAWNLPRQ